MAIVARVRGRGCVSGILALTAISSAWDGPDMLRYALPLCLVLLGFAIGRLTVEGAAFAQDDEFSVDRRF